jgi:hypothetical protein
LRLRNALTKAQALHTRKPDDPKARKLASNLKAAAKYLQKRAAN